MDFFSPCFHFRFYVFLPFSIEFLLLLAEVHIAIHHKWNCFLLFDTFPTFRAKGKALTFYFSVQLVSGWNEIEFKAVSISIPNDAPLGWKLLALNHMGELSMRRYRQPFLAMWLGFQSHLLQQMWDTLVGFVQQSSTHLRNHLDCPKQRHKPFQGWRYLQLQFQHARGHRQCWGEQSYQVSEVGQLGHPSGTEMIIRIIKHVHWSYMKLTSPINPHPVRTTWEFDGTNSVPSGIGWTKAPNRIDRNVLMIATSARMENGSGW